MTAAGGILPSTPTDTTPAADAAGVVAVSSTAAQHRWAEAGTIAMMAVWAGNFIVVKSAIGILPPVGFTFIRFVLAGVVLLAMCLAREGSVRLPRRDLVPIAALGALGFGAYQMLWTTALQDTAAGTSSLIVASTPIFTMVIAAAVGSDTFTRNRGLGALLGFGGVALVIGAGSGLAFDGRLLGELMTLLAALLWAAYMAFGAPFLRRHSPLRTSAWAIVAGSVVLAPVGLLQLSTVDVSVVTVGVVGAIVYSGVLAAAIANVIVFRGVQLLGPTRIANLQFLVPAMAVALAAVFLGEPIQPAQVVGGTVIVLGILVARSDRGMRDRVLSPV